MDMFLISIRYYKWGFIVIVRIGFYFRVFEMMVFGNIFYNMWVMYIFSVYY